MFDLILAVSKLETTASTSATDKSAMAGGRSTGERIMTVTNSHTVNKRTTGEELIPTWYYSTVLTTPVGYKHIEKDQLRFQPRSALRLVPAPSVANITSRVHIPIFGRHVNPRIWV
ncbi:uncharacterized protein LAJ45_04949 [Morchella importuna]|uniref:uncharacterized protein n=1 Tax=Morchella importuna TaxID=1174673 RepID=UPI001E8E99EB|nr:uncharacterized protein LAJ45_04949 [Morchella importuna]KAH8150770.1 hypothetical protein LAJ45_04949 [Morchella importuna]